MRLTLPDAALPSCATLVGAWPELLGANVVLDIVCDNVLSDDAIVDGMMVTVVVVNIAVRVGRIAPAIPAQIWTIDAEVESCAGQADDCMQLYAPSH